MAVCECGCGGEMNAGSKWKFLRGHKPKGKLGGGRSTTALARREAQVVIDAPEDDVEGDAEIYVDCQMSVSQIDKVLGFLSPQAKAVAMLNGLNEEG